MGCSAPTRCEILVLVGSSRQESVNAGLAEELRRFAISPRVEVKLSFPSLDRLPVFNTDLEKNLFMPAEVKKLRRKAAAVDAIILITPQINGSVSPVLLNALYWLSRSYEREVPLLHKKAGIVCASYLSQNPIIECVEMGKYFKMNFFKEAFYLFLGNKVTDHSGKLTSAFERGRLEEWYAEFLKFATCPETAN